MQEEHSEEVFFGKNPWKVPELGVLFPGCEVELSSWLAVGKQSCLPLSKSSHLIIITCYSRFSLEHDLLQPLNSNANFLQMFLAKLWMNLLSFQSPDWPYVHVSDGTSLPGGHKYSRPDFSGQSSAKKKPFGVLQMFRSWKLSHVLSQMTAKTCTVSHHNYKAATLHFFWRQIWMMFVFSAAIMIISILSGQFETPGIF